MDSNEKIQQSGQEFQKFFEKILLANVDPANAHSNFLDKLNTILIDAEGNKSESTKKILEELITLKLITKTEYNQLLEITDLVSSVGNINKIPPILQRIKDIRDTMINAESSLITLALASMDRCGFGRKNRCRSRSRSRCLYWFHSRWRYWFKGTSQRGLNIIRLILLSFMSWIPVICFYKLKTILTDRNPRCLNLGVLTIWNHGYLKRQESISLSK